MNTIKLFLFSLLLVTNIIHADEAADVALRDAARIGNIDQAKTALDAGADINSRSVTHNGLPHYSALMLAAIYKHPAMISFLIAQGADIDQQSVANDESALSMAWGESLAWNNLQIPEIILILLNAGANAQSIVCPPHRVLTPFHKDALYDKDRETATPHQISKNLLAIATTSSIRMFLELEEIAQHHRAHPNFQTYSEEFRDGYAHFIAQHKKRVTTPRSLRDQICRQVKKTLEQEEKEEQEEVFKQVIQKMREEECRIRTTPATQKAINARTSQDTPAAHGWFDRCSIQ